MNRKTSYVREFQVFLSDVNTSFGNATFGTIEISTLWLDWCLMLDIKNFDAWVVQRRP